MKRGRALGSALETQHQQREDGGETQAAAVLQELDLAQRGSAAIENRLEIPAEIRIVQVASELFRPWAQGGHKHRMVRMRGREPIRLCVIRDHHAERMRRWIEEQGARERLAF